ncbi:MAG: Hpt domain-containing protein [Synergistaceae bacterium]|jgi:HPt (histidine-containing phosphotransfer) domain-containing protein|nr:Hpt domain-containing protein [Synergistaceae bacterium]
MPVPFDAATSLTSHDGGLASDPSEIRPAAINRRVGLKNSAGDETLYRDLLSNFVSDHALDWSLIGDAAGRGDIAVARRIAHTLKSVAALIGARRLHNIAWTIEEKFTEGDGSPTADEMLYLDAEMRAVLAEIDSSETGRSADKREPIALDRDGASDLMERLLPLLESGNAASLDMTDEIRSILSPLGDSANVLAERIQNFDFDEALNVLTELQRKMDAVSDRKPS